MTQTPQKYENPFIGQPTTRTNVEVADEALAKLQSVRPRRGTISITLNLLLYKLVNELAARNLTDYSNIDAFERFIAECRFATPAECDYAKLPQLAVGSADTQPHAEESPRDDKRGVVVTRSEVADTTHFIPDAQSRPRRGGRRGVEVDGGKTKTGKGRSVGKKGAKGGADHE